jgi:hypothetical protein
VILQLRIPVKRTSNLRKQQTNNSVNVIIAKTTTANRNRNSF